MTTDFPLPEALAQLFLTAGFQQPTAIQAATYTAIYQGTDVLGLAPTGSGKTLAFLLPSLVRLKEQAGKQLLILAPSQELAMQTAEVCRPYAQALDLQVLPLIGGGSVKRQQEKLKSKPQVLIGTPGRVLELLQAKKIKWPQLATIVLDEVDQLLAQKDNLTSKILRHGPKHYQLLGFSATALSQTSVRELFASAQVVDVLKTDTSQGTITLSYLVTEKRKKVQILKSLAQVPGMRGIVFFNQVADLGAAYEKLQYEGVPVASLASDEDKFVRKAAMSALRAGKIQFLLTTDVAARGIDLPQLPFVIFYEVPLNGEQLTHRKGRTGRMGEDGEVIVLLEKNWLPDLQKLDNTFQEKWLYAGALQSTPPVKSSGSNTNTKKTKANKRKKK